MSSAAVNTCDEPLTAVNHILLGCSDGYNYMSECWFGCQSGYHLPDAGVSRTTCVLSGVAAHVFMAWDSLITDCSRTYTQHCDERTKHCDEHTQHCDERTKHCDEHTQHCDVRTQHCDERTQHCDERTQHCDERTQHCDERTQHCDERSLDARSSYLLLFAKPSSQC